MGEIIKIGTVELRPREVEKYHRKNLYIVAYRSIYDIRKDLSTGEYYGKRIGFKEHGLPLLGYNRFSAMSAKAVNELVKTQLVDDLGFEVDFKEIKARYRDFYDFLYKNNISGERYDSYVLEGSIFLNEHTDFVSKFVEYNGDAVTSDREVAAFALAIRIAKGVEPNEYVSCV